MKRIFAMGLGLAIVLMMAVASLGVTGTALAQNLIVNGDFELGNTGFNTNYLYGGVSTSAGTYCIDVNPFNCHSGGASYKDHTSGNGLMMIANGGTRSDVTVWQQMLSITSNSDYIFSGWVASWGKSGGDSDPNPAKLRFYVNGTQAGEDFVAAAKNGVWSRFSIYWNSGVSTSAILKIVDANLEGFGNDFSLDDLSFVSALACSDVAVKPHTFTAGTSAKATEVNADFDTLYQQINTQNCRIQTLNSQLQALKAIVCKNEPTASVCQ
jgi:hypothetical protein